MSRESLTIERRDASGKSPTARRLRTSGRVPGVIYHPEGNIPFSADALAVAALHRHGSTLIDAQLDGTEQLTVLKEFQIHPVRGSVEHVDLQAVSMDQTVRTLTTLTLVGEAPGVKEGGILTQGTRELLIECTAAQIPDTIEFDVSDVHVGETRILRDVQMPEGVTPLDDLGQMVIAVTVPRGAKGKRAGMTMEESDAADAAEAAGESAAAAGGTAEA